MPVRSHIIIVYNRDQWALVLQLERTNVVFVIQHGKAQLRLGPICVREESSLLLSVGKLFV